MEPDRSFRSAARRDIGLVFAERPRTLYEASKALGRQTGSIANLTKRMVQEGVLEASDDPPVRGTTYWLASHARPLLKAATEQSQPTGRLQPQQHLLLIDSRDRETALQRVIANPEHSTAISWAADIDGTSRLLIALSPDATALAARNLYVDLESAGIDCARRMVGELLSADDLRRQAVSSLQRAVRPRQ